MLASKSPARRNPALPLLLLLPLLALASPARAGSQTVYFNDFEGAVGPEWSHTNTERTPFGDRGFLGQFGNDSVTLTLDNLPPHTALTVSFDLFVIRSWDGVGE